ncbi:hypothetical protein U879_07790 [Defluviimonas sp. 20V17]|uniref:Uncharacterized protein n=1 Tax=Allgaiera indica TaxID=765699 RepID=A0AAN5A0K2_9RHOB|nr:hypothetical protein [Allgaiera indica]KDB04246.1 hypothetical protein U879_07790 [Defluviimonas sp. 20V17]GHE03657.1 hypothetical protein GCM10008024_27890 [Allgaiera indica]SDX74957.1 hypothetical protein SAMN05444006_12750 [Allgaiera indica]
MAEVDAPVRVIVHAGFHKTGTTSLQVYLENNRAALAPYLAYYGKSEMPDLDEAARLYGLRPFPWRLAAFRSALRVFLTGLPPAPVIALSRERFCGAMPGLRGWHGRRRMSYAPTAIALARVLTEEIARRFGPGTRVEFLYTLRAREPWLHSLYGHLLRVTRLRDDFDRFRRRFPARFSLETEAALIAGALAPVPVHTAPLEALAEARAGPAQALFDLLDLPAEVTAALPPARRWNRGHPAKTEARFLHLNRAGGGARTRRAIKEDLGRRQRARPEKPGPER